MPGYRTPDEQRARVRKLVHQLADDDTRRFGGKSETLRHLVAEMAHQWSMEVAGSPTATEEGDVRAAFLRNLQERMGRELAELADRGWKPGTFFESVSAEIVETTPMRTLDERRAALYAQNVAAVFSGTEWLTTEEVGQLRQPTAANPYAAATRWRRQGRIFGVQRQGRTYYPRYEFTEAWEPNPAVAQVLKALDGYSDMRVASWFESTNSFLGGRRPRELVATAPEMVVTAAEEHAAGISHG